MTKQAGLVALQKLKTDLGSLTNDNCSSWLHQGQHLTKELFGENSGIYRGFFNFNFYDAFGLNVIPKIRQADALISGAISMVNTLPDDEVKIPEIQRPAKNEWWFNKLNGAGNIISIIGLGTIILGGGYGVGWIVGETHADTKNIELRRDTAALNLNISNLKDTIYLLRTLTSAEPENKPRQDSGIK